MGLRIRLFLIFFVTVLGFALVYVAMLFGMTDQDHQMAQHRTFYQTLKIRQNAIDSVDENVLTQQLILKDLLLRSQDMEYFLEQRTNLRALQQEMDNHLKVLSGVNDILIGKDGKQLKLDIDDLSNKYKDWQKKTSQIMAELRPPPPVKQESQGVKGARKGSDIRLKNEPKQKPETKPSVKEVKKEVKRDWAFFKALDKQLANDEQELLKKIVPIREAFDSAFKRMVIKEQDVSNKNYRNLLFLISAVPVVALVFVWLLQFSLGRGLLRQLGADPKEMKKILQTCKNEPTKPIPMPMMAYGTGSVYDLLHQVLIERPFPVDHSLLAEEEAQLSSDLDATLSQSPITDYTAGTFQDVDTDAYYRVEKGIPVEYPSDVDGGEVSLVKTSNPSSFDNVPPLMTTSQQTAIESVLPESSFIDAELAKIHQEIESIDLDSDSERGLPDVVVSKVDAPKEDMSKLLNKA